MEVNETKALRQNPTNPARNIRFSAINMLDFFIEWNEINKSYTQPNFRLF